MSDNNELPTIVDPRPPAPQIKCPHCRKLLDNLLTVRAGNYLVTIHNQKDCQALLALDVLPVLDPTRIIDPFEGGGIHRVC